MRWQQALVLGCPSLGASGVSMSTGVPVSCTPVPAPLAGSTQSISLKPGTGHSRCPGETGPRARIATHGAPRYLPSLTQPPWPGPCTQCPIRAVNDQHWCPMAWDTPGVTPGQDPACPTVPGWPEQTRPACMVPDTPAGSCSGLDSLACTSLRQELALLSHGMKTYQTYL